jgi:hypothetical protein
MKRGPWQMLRALDRLANAILWGDGDQTISARAGYAQYRGKAWGRIAAPIIDAITFEKNHCRKAAIREGLIPHAD